MDNLTPSVRMIVDIEREKYMNKTFISADPKFGYLLEPILEFLSELDMKLSSHALY